MNLCSQTHSVLSKPAETRGSTKSRRSLPSFRPTGLAKAGNDNLHLYSWAHTFTATWIAFVGLPIWLVNTSPARLSSTLCMRDYAAFVFYFGALVFESVADYQKYAWRKAKDAKQHDENFISSGLWGISRHPKYVFSTSSCSSWCCHHSYVGEVGIWTGIWALSAAPLQSAFTTGTVVLAVISPLFTWFLLQKVSLSIPAEFTC